MWGEVELAWRLRDLDHLGARLCVTRTNGKTTTVQMLDTILQAGGLIGCASLEGTDPESSRCSSRSCTTMPALRKTAWSRALPHRYVR